MQKEMKTKQESVAGEGRYSRRETLSLPRGHSVLPSSASGLGTMSWTSSPVQKTHGTLRSLSVSVPVVPSKHPPVLRWHSQSC